MDGVAGMAMMASSSEAVLSDVACRQCSASGMVLKSLVSWGENQEKGDGDGDGLFAWYAASSFRHLAFPPAPFASASASASTLSLRFFSSSLHHGATTHTARVASVTL